MDRDLLRVTFTQDGAPVHVGLMLHAPRVGEYVKLPTGEYRVLRVCYDLRECAPGHCQSVTVEVGKA